MMKKIFLIMLFCTPCFTLPAHADTQRITLKHPNIASQTMTMQQQARKVSSSPLAEKQAMIGHHQSYSVQEANSVAKEKDNTFTISFQ